MATIQSSNIFNNKSLPYILIAPSLTWYLIFWVRPVINSVKDSFFNLDGSFTLMNYISVFSDPVFPQALANTFILVIISVFLEFVIAFGLALLVNRKFTGSSVFLLICLLPWSLAPVAVGAIWKSCFSTYGWLNGILYSLGFIEESEKIAFLTGEWGSTLLIIIFIEIWTVVPSVMVILLAGLQGLNKELAEAGQVFGASKWTVLRKITIPLLKPTITTALIIRIIAALQIWGIIVMIVGYLRFPTLVEQLVFFYDNRGQADPVYELRALAFSVIVALIVSLVVLVYLKLSGTTEE